MRVMRPHQLRQKPRDPRRHRGKLRHIRVDVHLDDDEATTLDTLRGPKSRAAHLRERGLMPVEPAKEPE